MRFSNGSISTMFAFGTDQNALPKNTPPPAADWMQLVQSDKTKAPLETAVSPYDRCNEIASQLKDTDAKELLKAMVFLTSRSNER